mgnify:CR=1 FL=1|jgi:hypothetical protein
MPPELARAQHCINMAEQLHISAARAIDAQDKPRYLRLLEQARQYIELAHLNVESHGLIT